MSGQNADGTGPTNVANESKDEKCGCGCAEDRSIFYTLMDLDEHHGIRHGYHDDENRELVDAIQNMNEILADRVGISEGDRVLDIGCGVGGSAVWLAETYGAEVVGINIENQQLEQARSFAEERGVADLVEFQHDDFHEMATVDDDSFDVAWAIESLCYAEDKPKVLQQAARTLKPGGRIVCSDIFDTSKERGDAIRRRTRKIQWGYSHPPLAGEEQFADELARVGFENVTVTDVTGNAIPTAKFIHDISFQYLKGKGIEDVIKQEEALLDVILAGVYSYAMMEEGYLSYCHMTATLPS